MLTEHCCPPLRIYNMVETRKGGGCLIRQQMFCSQRDLPFDSVAACLQCRVPVTSITENKSLAPGRSLPLRQETELDWYQLHSADAQFSMRSVQPQPTTVPLRKHVNICLTDYANLIVWIWKAVEQEVETKLSTLQH
jgi:hypothetical protein